MRSWGKVFGGLIAACMSLAPASSTWAQSAPPQTSPTPQPVLTPNPLQPVSPAIAPGASAGSTAPFGPGHAVSFDSSRPFTYAWIARGVVSTDRSYPDPFTKIGRLPTRLQLPTGKYTLLVEGDEVTGGSTVLDVPDGPRSVKVQAGSGGMRELSGWMIAIGAAAALAGGVLYVSGTKNDDEDRKNSISIPLAIGGGVLLVGGVSLYLVSATSFRTDPAPRDQAFSRSNSRPTLALGGLW